MPDSRRQTPSKPYASQFFMVIKPEQKNRDMLVAINAKMAFKGGGRGELFRERP
jgi:hypothetical protein